MERYACDANSACCVSYRKGIHIFGLWAEPFLSAGCRPLQRAFESPNTLYILPALWLF